MAKRKYKVVQNDVPYGPLIDENGVDNAKEFVAQQQAEYNRSPNRNFGMERKHGGVYGPQAGKVAISPTVPVVNERKPDKIELDNSKAKQPIAANDDEMYQELPITMRNILDPKYSNYFAWNMRGNIGKARSNSTINEALSSYYYNTSTDLPIDELKGMYDLEKNNYYIAYNEEAAKGAKRVKPDYVMSLMGSKGKNIKGYMVGVKDGDTIDFMINQINGEPLNEKIIIPLRIGHLNARELRDKNSGTITRHGLVDFVALLDLVDHSFGKGSEMDFNIVGKSYDRLVTGGLGDIDYGENYGISYNVDLNTHDLIVSGMNELGSNQPWSTPLSAINRGFTTQDIEDNKILQRYIRPIPNYNPLVESSPRNVNNYLKAYNYLSEVPELASVITLGYKSDNSKVPDRTIYNAQKIMEQPEDQNAFKNKIAQSKNKTMETLLQLNARERANKNMRNRFKVKTDKK